MTNFEGRKEIQDKVRKLCAEFEDNNKDLVVIDKVGNRKWDRGFIKNMFSYVCEKYSSEKIVPQYTGLDLWYICCIGEVMLEICDRYNAIPNFMLLSIITGVSVYAFNKIYAGGEQDLIARMDGEYERDFRTFFKKVYNEEKKITFEGKINLTLNTEHNYPVYCLLAQIKEYEKDGRIERGRLGDITQLNAPVEVGGFGFAHPTITVDNRKLIIGDEAKLLETYASAKQHLRKVEVDKDKKAELEKEKEDLFAEDRE